MSYSNPTTDIAFKKLFGSQKHTDITISFLNSVLEKKEGELITHIVINDNANLPIIEKKKISFIDVSCTDQAGKHYIVEMQVEAERDFLERAQYYTAFRLARQLNKKDEYKNLVPVIFVAVLDFKLFDGPDYLTHNLIADSKTGMQTMHHMEFHFIELKKFKKELDQLTTITDQWIYLIKKADKMNQIPRQMQSCQEIVEALHVLEQDSWTLAELEAYQVELDEWRIRTSVLETAREEGLSRGLAQGLSQGISQGISQGLSQGERKKALEIALEMLADGIRIEKIAQFTKLSIEEIQAINKV